MQAQAARARAYYLANQEHIKSRSATKRRSDPAFEARQAKRSAEWQQQNKLRVRALQKRWKLENGKRYRQKSMLASARRRAIAKGWEFNLSSEDVRIPDICPVFGTPFHFGVGKTDASVSLDRIDNSRGYVRGNVIVVSELANRMKSSGTIDQLRTLANFYERLGGISQP